MRSLSCHCLVAESFFSFRTHFQENVLIIIVCTREWVLLDDDCCSRILFFFSLGRLSQQSFYFVCAEKGGRRWTRTLGESFFLLQMKLIIVCLIFQQHNQREDSATLKLAKEFSLQTDETHQNIVKKFYNLEHRHRCINLYGHFYCPIFSLFLSFMMLFSFHCNDHCKFTRIRMMGNNVVKRKADTHCRTMYFRYDYVFALCALIYVSGCCRQLLCAFFYVHLWLLLRLLDALNICNNVFSPI